MINPSINGWIDKLFSEQHFTNVDQSYDEFYCSTRKTGFVFGHIIYLDAPIPIDTSKWLSDEVSKVGLLLSLFRLYAIHQKNVSKDKFIEKTVAFYSQLHPKSKNILKKMLPASSNSHQLETFINDRVKTNEDLFSKNFSHVVTNALLFLDVLAYFHFLEHAAIPDKYENHFEELLLSIVSLSLKTKTSISVHDDLLLKLFESSLRYSKNNRMKLNDINDLHLDIVTIDLEKKYLIDLAGLSLWSDEKVENEERYFLYKLGEKLGVQDSDILESIHFINHFISSNKNEIPYFKSSNPVKNFYDHTTENVAVLINRNKNRLIKEMSQSKELMQLLAKSSVQELNKEEKKKIKKQLLDVCKSIPSLTIFLLPGGSLLLPILIKFIPQLLPSAFNENQEEI
jgi:hypothetical protein